MSTHLMGKVKTPSKSVKISDCKHYLTLLLTGSASQSKSLLLLASDREIHCVISILREILSLPVSRATKALLSKRKNITIIKALANKSTKLSQQRKIFKEYHKRILFLLKSTKNRLLEHLN